MIIFVASNRIDIYDEIRASINKYVKKGKVVDLFPLVNEDNDRKIEALRLWANAMEIEGEMAEAGVRDGAFAKYINKYFPEKKLYLFDTFEGFNNELVKQNMIADDVIFKVNMDYRNFYHETKGLVAMPNPESILCGYETESC